MYGRVLEVPVAVFNAAAWTGCKSNELNLIKSVLLISSHIRNNICI